MLRLLVYLLPFVVTDTLTTPRISSFSFAFMRITGLTRPNATLGTPDYLDFLRHFREYGAPCNAFVDTTIPDLHFPILPILENTARQSFTTSHCRCTVSKSPTRTWPFLSLSPLLTPSTLRSGICSWTGLYYNPRRSTNFFARSWATSRLGTTTRLLSLTFSSASTGFFTPSSHITRSTAVSRRSSSRSRKRIAAVSGRYSALRTNMQLM